MEGNSGRYEAARHRLFRFRFGGFGPPPATCPSASSRLEFGIRCHGLCPCLGTGGARGTPIVSLDAAPDLYGHGGDSCDNNSRESLPSGQSGPGRQTPLRRNWPWSEPGAMLAAGWLGTSDRRRSDRVPLDRSPTLPRNARQAVRLPSPLRPIESDLRGTGATLRAAPHRSCVSVVG